MNVQDQINNKTWVSYPTVQVVAFIVTFGQENQQKYKTIITGLLPEVLKQHKLRKDAIDFVLRRWNIASNDNELEIISRLLKRAIKLAEKIWLIALLSGVVLVGTGSVASISINNKQEVKQPPEPTRRIPDCVKQSICISLAELAQIENLYLDISELTVQFRELSTPDDRLSIRNQGINSGEVGIDGQDVTYEGTIIGSFKGGDGTNPLMVSFNSNATREAAQSVIRSITYENISKNPSPGTRTVEFKITDGNRAINEPPFTTSFRIIPNTNGIVFNAPNNVIAKENSDLLVSGISLSAPDKEEFTVILEVASGTLSVKTDVTNGLIANKIRGNKTEKVTLTGTVAQINTTLASTAAVTYRGRKGFTGEDFLILTGNINKREKGLVWPPKAQNHEPVSQRTSITVNPLNPPPVVTVPEKEIANENTELPISPIKIEDPNNEIIIVNLEVSNGTLTIKSDVPNGLTANSISNNKTNKVTIKSSIIRINNTLADSAGLIYKSNQEYTGEDNLKVTANDGNKIGTSNIGILVNDNPVLSVPEYVTTSNGMIITKAEAMNLIESWLVEKKNVFAFPYNFQVIDRYTTGEYRKAREGSVEWLKKYNGYYTFGSPKVSSTGKFFAQENQVKIDVRVYQEQTLRVNEEIDPTQSRLSDGVYRYTLQLDNGSWKIANSQDISK
ncbi:DUF4101 domain-containing protein [Calothrix sp. FACHB-1219]|uniref:ARC6/PARC6 family protein n=1 Tax=unclassified Calothrix TaxID=2619626 RepID=UPI001686398B|nr:MULTISPECIES: ARC6/PARC6 family protein [unclassified Calothrix]MBD2205595.1 DUF4101 domain-containing protein [Calothrix sp. FACHB-168]MBD2220258.1 DUF4101 domain-containing protein [Calothrix sp. FACHB-1219]